MTNEEKKANEVYKEQRTEIDAQARRRTLMQWQENEEIEDDRVDRLEDPQPWQDARIDKHNVLRFRPNAIVRALLGAGPLDMNRLAVMPFSDEDRVQFAQLIGYSLSGFMELSYVDDESWNKAAEIYNKFFPDSFK